MTAGTSGLRREDMLSGPGDLTQHCLRDGLTRLGAVQFIRADPDGGRAMRYWLTEDGAKALMRFINSKGGGKRE